MSKQKFELKLKEHSEQGNLYEVNVELPLSTGWIDNLQIILETRNKRIVKDIKYDKIENDTIYFKNDLYLETQALYKYYFTCLVEGRRVNFKNKQITKEYEITNEEMYKMSVNFETPEWTKGKLMYHIFVDRFNKGRKEKLNPMPRRTIHNKWDEEPIIGPDANGIWNADFYGGDLKGIIDKLDYIYELGVTILYLSPIVTSQSNHRYDTADYENVDPYVGVNEDLKTLCKEAHKRNMKVVLDAVFNHTGNDSIYYNEFKTYGDSGAYNDPNCKYSKFYRKNNNQFDFWWGMRNLPVCNGDSKEWCDYILAEGGIIDKWFNLGIDGLRLDVADELTDKFIEGIRIAVKRNKKDGFILGEVWKDVMSMDREYIRSGKGMDSIMNYFFMDALIRYYKDGDVHKLKDTIKNFEVNYPNDILNSSMLFTSTHDISRAINIIKCDDFNKNGEWRWNLYNESLDYCKNYKLEDRKKAKDLYKAYISMIMFMPGILSIFYGDEIGMEGMGNLANRKPYPWGKEDKELLDFFKVLGNIKKNEKILADADLKILEINNDYILFERNKNDEKIVVGVNRTGDVKIINKQEENELQLFSLNESNSKKLNPHGAFVIKKTKNTTRK